MHGRRYAEKVASLPFRVAEIEGERVGAVSSSLYDHHLWVNELVVSPAFQNRRVGSQLLLQELERARAAGVPVRLHTFRLNRATRFHERHGFMITERRDDYIHLTWPPHEMRG